MKCRFTLPCESKIIGLLKERLIFKERQDKTLSFVRQIDFGKDSVIVIDLISAPQGANVMRAPRPSKRHVASADSYHLEDFCLTDNSIEMRETREKCADVLKITTLYEVNL